MIYRALAVNDNLVNPRPKSGPGADEIVHTRLQATGSRTSTAQ